MVHSFSEIRSHTHCGLFIRVGLLPHGFIHDGALPVGDSVVEENESHDCAKCQRREENMKIVHAAIERGEGAVYNSTTGEMIRLPERPPRQSP